jgi:hypothetical protein
MTTWAPIIDPLDHGRTPSAVPENACPRGTSPTAELAIQPNPTRANGGVIVREGCLESRYTGLAGECHPDTASR